jgi:hypothetical protein
MVVPGIDTGVRVLGTTSDVGPTATTGRPPRRERSARADPPLTLHTPAESPWRDADG